MAANKTAIVTARMTPKVKEQLQQRAKEAELTLTDYLCICGLGQKIVQVDGLDEVLSELKAQGRNLNQLTTLAKRSAVCWATTTQDLPSGPTLTLPGNSRIEPQRRWEILWRRLCECTTGKKKPGRKATLPLWHSLILSGHFAVWVTVWVSKKSQK